MKKAVLSIAMFAAFSGANAVPIQTSASPVDIPAGTGGTFQTGELLGASTQQINFQVLSPGNAVRVAFSWNEFVTLGSAMLLSSSGPGAWSTTAGTSVSMAFDNSEDTGSLSWTNVSSGYYVLQFGVTQATSSGQKINGNIDVRNVVPAPAALSLVGLGLIGLGWFGTKRKS
jgi:hypothetical protein